MIRLTFTLAALLCAAPALAQLGSTPVGEPPGPGFAWRSLPGIGYGWVQDGITTAPNPAIGTAFAATRTDALDAVNAKRAARGLRPYIHDPALTAGAENLARFRAANRIAGHLANDFSMLPPGCGASATGCAALSPEYGFMACEVYSSSYTYAGAAWVTGSDGKLYCHLVLR